MMKRSSHIKPPFGLNPLDKVAAENLPIAITFATRMRKDAHEHVTKKND